MVVNMKRVYWYLIVMCLGLFQVPAGAQETGPVAERIEQIVSEGAAAEDEPLHPNKAFVWTAEATGPGTVHFHWTIAEGYYLYTDKFRFEIGEGEATIDSAAIQLPKGKVKEDPSFGRIEVVYHETAIDVPVQRTNTAETPITIKFRYQGCKENSICYPPQKKQVSLVLAATDAATAPAVNAAAQGVMAQAEETAVTPDATSGSAAGSGEEKLQMSEQDSITEKLKSGSMFLNILTFFGFGLLLSLTPCVFPMIPILSGIIIGQGKQITTMQGFTLSLIYVIAMALTYALAGVVAAMLNFNIQAAAQNVWLLTFFSLVFVALALSMFGFYEIQLPSAVQTKLASMSDSQKGGSFIGVFIMGALSAIIVGPCVAPPLAGALLYISQTGDKLLGGLALFALGIGMGVPLLAIGASAGSLLPRAGTWMEMVKYVFGVLMLAVAVWFVSRVLPPMVELYLWAALLIVTAIYMGALDRLPDGATWRKLWKGVGVVMLVYGAILIVGGSAGSTSIFKPLAGLALGGGGNEAAAEKEGLPFQRIKSLADLNAAVAAASQQGKPVMLDFYADWCVACVEMETYTFPKPEVHEALKDAVLLQADVTTNDDIDQELMQNFNIFGPPAILFFGADGLELKAYRLVGFKEADEFVAHVNSAIGL
jgi:thiol:disulfide interchange protein DsbD